MRRSPATGVGLLSIGSTAIAQSIQHLRHVLDPVTGRSLKERWVGVGTGKALQFHGADARRSSGQWPASDSGDSRGRAAARPPGSAPATEILGMPNSPLVGSFSGNDVHTEELGQQSIEGDSTRELQPVSA